MKPTQLSRPVEEGEYEAILRVMHIYPFRCEQCRTASYQPLCHVDLFFEILDGSPDADDPTNWLGCTSQPWPEPDLVLDRMMKMVEEPGVRLERSPVPGISTAPVGRRFRVLVHQSYSITDPDAPFYESVVGAVLGLAEPATDTKVKKA